MQQILHLCIVDRDRAAALATWYGPKWLLPVISCSERARAAPAAARWASEVGVAWDVAGQWLGRLAAEGTDWLIAGTAQCPPAIDSKLQWTPLTDLSSSLAVIDYQGWAIAQCLENGPLPLVPGPFGNLTWLNDVRRWIRASAGALVGAITPYRVSPYEVVLGVDTHSGRVYFKGLDERRALEARLTMTLAAIVPGAFAQTLAVESKSDGSVWWLTCECPGTTTLDGGLVARPLARLQRRLMASGPLIGELRPLDLDEAVRWASTFVAGSACVPAIAEQTERVKRAAVPESWIPMDLHPTNVLVDGAGQVRFIDLDDSYLGPAPLAMALFAQRCRKTSHYRPYEESWCPALRHVDWPAFEAVAALLDARHGWLRIERYTRSGEVYGALDVAASRIRQRLEFAFSPR